PGIGKATAGSLRAFIWDEPEIFIETNIRRIYIHFFLHEKKQVTDEEITRYIRRTLPQNNFREWYWALMDYGAMLGARAAREGKANKTANPNRKSAHYRKQAVFKGSDRELRGKILKLLLKERRISLKVAAKDI